jgi:hypothetical protein
LLDCELITLISAIACAIIKCNDEDTISILAVSLTQLGDTLATYLTQKDIMEKRTQDDDDKIKEKKWNKDCKENEEG